MIPETAASISVVLNACHSRSCSTSRLPMRGSSRGRGGRCGAPGGGDRAGAPGDGGEGAQYRSISGGSGVGSTDPAVPSQAFAQLPSSYAACRVSLRKVRKSSSPFFMPIP